MSAARCLLRTIAASALSLMLLSVSIRAQAQQPYPNYPATQQPQPPQQVQPAYPQQPAPYPYPPQQPPRKPGFLRELFAGTIGAILQGIGGIASGTLVQGLTGTIVSWFDRKQNAAAAYPPAQYAQYPGYVPNTPQGYPPANGYPNSSYPNAGAYPDPNAYSYAPQLYDPRTGQVSTTDAQAYYSRDAQGYGTPLVAGVAYEVHALAQNGAMPINPATYAFRTGDRFVVHFRPSMPGRMDVYNINPLGVQTRIDSANMAAGQLMTLGPYEFTAAKGEDSLRLVLMPCARNDLIVATRSIVNVQADPTVAAPANGFSLSSCDALITRSVTTRDITKVAVDGTTSFALDPISAQEYSSGQLDPREVTVVFRHQ